LRDTTLCCRLAVADLFPLNPLDHKHKEKEEADDTTPCCQLAVTDSSRFELGTGQEQGEGEFGEHNTVLPVDCKGFIPI